MRFSLKLIIDSTDKYTETEIIIRCRCIDKEVEKIIEFLKKPEKNENLLTVQTDEITKKIKLEDIFHIESVNKRTFVYTEDNVYRCKEKLYELEEILKFGAFVRISKSCILNTDCLESIRASFNYSCRILIGKFRVMCHHNDQSFFRNLFYKWQSVQVTHTVAFCNVLNLQYKISP